MTMRVMVVAFVALALPLAGCLGGVECSESKPTRPEATVVFLGPLDPGPVRSALDRAGWSVGEARDGFVEANRVDDDGTSSSVVLTADRGGAGTLASFTRTSYSNGTAVQASSPQEARELLLPVVAPTTQALAEVLGEPVSTQYKGGLKDCSPGGLLG